MIEFSHEKDAIPLGDLVRLFARGANWKMPLARDDWRDLLRHSPLVVTAWKDGQLVGFARLLTDFVRWALYDVVVDPSFQRQGIGSNLVQRLLDHPRVTRVRTVWLGTAEGHAFYERFGFVRDGNGQGMLLVRRDRDDRLAVGSQLAEVANTPTELVAERPSFLVSSSEVPEEPGQHPGTPEALSHGRPIGTAAGLQRLGLHVERLPAGHRTSFPHAHEDEEEFVYVLDGEVDAWIDGTLHRMVAGDLAAEVHRAALATGAAPATRRAPTALVPSWLDAHEQEEVPMERVTGIGGIFFKAKDPAALATWYREKLGIETSWEHGAVFGWKEGSDEERPGSTVWSLFPAETRYFEPSRAPFLINYRVRDLDRMLAQLRAGGADVDEKVEASEYGKFGWVMDPEGNRIELWEPPAGA